MNLGIILFLALNLIASEPPINNSNLNQFYNINTPYKGKAIEIVEKDIANMLSFARANNFKGISITPDIVPFAERYLNYSNTGYDILMFANPAQRHAIHACSTLHPIPFELDPLVDNAELNILSWCMQRHVDYSSALSCTLRATNTVVAAALIDHNFFINDTRLHTLYTAQKARNQGYAKDLLNKVIRLSILNKAETISLYAASIGEANYRVDLSQIVSLYEKNGFKRKPFGHEMQMFSETVIPLLVQDPNEEIRLLFEDHSCSSP